MLGYLRDVFSELGSRKPITKFFDPFCGSGAVSRLARFMGYEVHANDLEFYAYVVTHSHLTNSRKDMSRLFRVQGGIEKAFRTLNASPNAAEPYMARHYAPKNTEMADYRTERLFYTQENARFIDSVRDCIESWYPGWNLDETASREKIILVSSLLYEAATHANTSGVFKAYHKGFGGHGKDALKRIMSPMEVEIPVLIDRSRPCKVSNTEAAVFVRSGSADLCYLDPPYNIHQYGSNYHVLNTIARWDKPPVSSELNADGRLKEKAAIPKTWMKTRSSYCSKRTAPAAFADLLDGIDAGIIALSYNTEGIIPFETLVEMMNAQGNLEFFTRDYVRYRGGKQSLYRQIHNMELVLVLMRSERRKPLDRLELELLLAKRRLDELLKRAFHPEKIKTMFRSRDGWVELHSDPVRAVWAAMDHLHTFIDTSELKAISDNATLSEIVDKLQFCLCATREEELDALIGILKSDLSPSERRSCQKRLLWVLRKYAFRKYRKEFAHSVEKIRRLMIDFPDAFSGMEQGLSELESRAALRFAH